MSEEKTVLPADSGLNSQNDLYLAGSAGNPHRDFVPMPIEHQIETRGSDREVPKLDPLEKRWKHRTIETHDATSPINVQS